MRECPQQHAQLLTGLHALQASSRSKEHQNVLSPLLFLQLAEPLVRVSLGYRIHCADASDQHSFEVWAYTLFLPKVGRRKAARRLLIVLEAQVSCVAFTHFERVWAAKAVADCTSPGDEPSPVQQALQQTPVHSIACHAASKLPPSFSNQRKHPDTDCRRGSPKCRSSCPVAGSWRCWQHAKRRCHPTASIGQTASPFVPS